MSRLLAVLSQHQLLTTLCTYLSSADVVHLTAVCKAAKFYITNSERIYAALKVNGVCDGTGVVARARIFGKHQDKCKETDALPCTECSALVCDNCRFHFVYKSDWERMRVKYFKYASGKFDLVSYETLESTEAAALVGVNTFPMAIKDIGSRKAYFIWATNREAFFCEQHQPLLVPSKIDGDKCHCNSPGKGFFDYFVKSRWLCLPCFFEMEVKTARSRPRIRLAYSQTSRQYYHEHWCKCGEMAMRYCTSTCRLCHRATCWYGGMEDSHMSRIWAQLGHEEKQEGELAELYAQLG